MRVAMVTTHPIQYQVPWLRLLGQQPDIDLRVFFAMIPDAAEQGREFGVAFQWDVPLLEGYAYTLLENVSKRPSLTEFCGCDTPQIHREIHEGGFDAVIVNGWVAKTCLQALWACLTSGTPCIVRGEANGLRQRAAWKRWLHNRLIARYDAYLAIGTQNRRYYTRAGVDERLIFDTPYCVDNERFSLSAVRLREHPGPEALRRRFGLEESRVTLLFSGKLVQKKRPADILAAMRLLPAAELSRVQLLVVGDGELRRELEQQANELPVHFAGFLNQLEIAAAYAVADCLVLPSDSGETWGLVVNEAMASGLPVLVSDQVGCAIDLVQDGVTGHSYPCGHVAALAELISAIARDRDALARQGIAARALVSSRFHFHAVVEGAIRALHAVVPKPVPSSA